MNLQTSMLTRKTGLPCPVSGIWETMGSFKTSSPIAKGREMPEYCGCKITWKLVQIC